MSMRISNIVSTVLVAFGAVATMPLQAQSTPELTGEFGSFAPSGWEVNGVALTRVEAVRAGLNVGKHVDERFDAMAVARAFDFYGHDSLAALLPQWKGQVIPKSAAGATYNMADVAFELGVPVREIKAANPHIPTHTVPAGAVLYGFTGVSALPWDSLAQVHVEDQAAALATYATRKERVLKRYPDPATHDALRYTVRSGDYLGRIASRYHVSVKDIQRWNNLKSTNIRAGQKLTIWTPAGKSTIATHSASAVAENKPAPAEPASTPAESAGPAGDAEGGYITYVVKAGDTLWAIAQKFPGVSADNLMAWNNIDANIKEGDKIKVRKDEISDYSAQKYPSTL